MDWTPKALDQVRTLWADGHSTAEIGRRMGISKNAIIGKAHRLNLPARPSPIIRDGRQSRPRRQPRTREAKEAAALKIATRNSGGHSIITRTLKLAPVVPLPPAVVFRGPSEPCCWINGQPAGRHTRYCDAPSLPRRPYCYEHAERARAKRVVADAA